MQELLKRNTLNECLLSIKPQSILDVGCGMGRWYEWCQKHHIGYKGFDIDPEVVNIARAEYHTNEEVFVTGDIGYLCDMKPNSYDVVLLVEVIEHIRNIELLTATLKQCDRVAKRFVFMTTPNCSNENELKEHGLIYEHYAYAAADGMQFRVSDRAHRHWLNFTFESLKGHLERHFPERTLVVEHGLIKVLTFPAYKKLWAVIAKEEHGGDTE